MANSLDFLAPVSTPTYVTYPSSFGSFQAIIGGKHHEERGIQPGDSFVPRMPHPNRIGNSTTIFLSEQQGYNEGFTEFTSPSVQVSGSQSVDLTNIKTFLQRKLNRGTRAHHLAVRGWNAIQTTRANVLNYEVEREYKDAEHVIDEFLTSIDGLDSWFGWLHFMEPHYPYNPTDGTLDRAEAQALSRRVTAGLGSEDDNRLARTLYREEIRELDTELTRLWEHLDDSTRVLLTGDHGECHGEDGLWGHGKIPFTTPEVMLRVPVATKNIPAPTGSVMSTIDIPTLLLDDEHGAGTFERDVAYATYEGDTIAMTADGIALPDTAFTWDGDRITNVALQDAARAFPEGRTLTN